jgi:hypothetical protein
MIDDLCELGIEKTSIIAKSRRIEFANFRVCYDCGSWLSHKDVECCNNKTETLKEHYERVECKPFVEEDWSMETEDLINIHGIDIDAEMTEILTGEIIKELQQKADTPYNKEILKEIKRLEIIKYKTRVEKLATADGYVDLEWRGEYLFGHNMTTDDKVAGQYFERCPDYD